MIPQEPRYSSARGGVLRSGGQGKNYQQEIWHSNVGTSHYSRRGPHDPIYYPNRDVTPFSLDPIFAETLLA